MPGAGRHLAPEGALSHDGPPSAPPPEVEGTPPSDHTFHSARESELRYQQDECDANRSWNARERCIIRGMEDHLGRSEDILVDVHKHASASAP